MYAVFWGVKKFEYELRGRKFKIESDHKPLAKIRNKADFNNTRINRMIEKLQEFDFEIDYKEPEKMVVADTLSRLYMTERENEKKRMIEARKEKQVEGKKFKHSKVIEGRNVLTFDSGEEREVLKKENRI
jgi:hypothetical protein